jgi:hypothetical protein
MSGTTVKGVKQRGPALFLRIRDVTVVPPDNGSMMQFFGMAHHEDELATRRKSGLYVPKQRELITCRAA